MDGVDDYLLQVIKGGDEMSSRLEKLLAPTLRNCRFAEILMSGVNGIKVIRPPEGKLAVVHSIGGNHIFNDSSAYVGSAFEYLISLAREIAAEPVAVANVIDSRTSDPRVVMPYAEAIASEANVNKLAVMNGEFAVLGDRMNAQVNINLTMLSFVDKNRRPSKHSIFERGGVNLAWFDPEGKPIYMNSDGVGTKSEFYERARRPFNGLIDSLAMKLDDLVKIGATARVVSDVFEFNRRGWAGFMPNPQKLVPKQDFIYLVQQEYVGNRIQSWDEELAINISGSAVSTIDERFLSNPPKPSAGEVLVAIRGRPNPRSNGISDKRKALVAMLGSNWHQTPAGKLFLEFVAHPSTIFYPFFREALVNEKATSVYHMSGGAYNGKLARPLAKQGLFVELENLFQPDWRELALAGAQLASAEVAYAKWPMGNEAFVTTRDPENILELARNYGFEGRVVGKIERAEEMRTGVLLKDIKGSDGKQVYFSGI